MKKLATILHIITFAVITSFAQIAPNTYWISFTDKQNNSYSIDKPGEFLSKRSIDRRVKQGITIKEEDLPVSQYYLDSLKKFNLEIKNVSKWFNAVSVYSTDTVLMDTIHQLGFVKYEVKSARIGKEAKINNKFLPISTVLKEAISEEPNQITQLNGNFLHDEGYMGQGMLIAVLDVGFLNADTISAFEYIRNSNRIIATRNFMLDNSGVYNSHSHGTKVLSLIAAQSPEGYPATAPEASYVLLRTERAASEYIEEEYNWLCAVEYADSLGVDVINSSLGYSTFDDPSQDHQYSDLNGITTPITRAATMASSKGMLVVTSAGNSGNDTWRYITAPGDADSILTIGAVDLDGFIAGFSSVGPSYDQRVKPDVMAMGVQNTVASSYGGFSIGSGTSYSSPVMAGLVTCLWQAYPYETCWTIMDVVRQSASLYKEPKFDMGYGIPDFELAMRILKEMNSMDTNFQSIFNPVLRGNPIDDDSFVKIIFKNEAISKRLKVDIVNMSGMLINLDNIDIKENTMNLSIGNYLKDFPTGIYMLQFQVDGEERTIKVLK
ncbi:MAG: S8 family serine peptidase [Bacteroidales bacterium]|nr:S8 family serine peptidase [Bacteroidales bacterium]